MLFTLKNIEMPKKFQKVEFKGWLRAALVLLYSVSIQIRSFELLAHFWPLNQFRNPSKRYTPFRTCRSQFVAFLQHQIWSTWGKIRGQKANFVHQELRENPNFWLHGFLDKSMLQKLITESSNSTDSSGHVKVRLWPFTPSNLVNLGQN